MFIGLIDAQGDAISPKLLARVPAEIVAWSLEYRSEGKIVFVNAKSLRMVAHETVYSTINKIGLFREADDMKPFIPPSDVHEYLGVRKADYMVLEPRALQFTLSFGGGSNQPNVSHLMNMIDNLTDQSLRHLHFIHDVAFTATGDLRVLARNYLREHGGFAGIRR
jgi:hypothetical protein